MNKLKLFSCILFIVFGVITLVGCSTPVAELEISVESASSDFEAVAYNSANLSDYVSANKNAPDFSSVGGEFKSGNYMIYEDIDFENGEYNTLLMTLSAQSGQAGKMIELYVDGVNGRMIGSIIVEETPKNTEFLDHYADIEEVSGIHDLYIVFPQDIEVSIDFFTFSTYNGTETAEEFDVRMEWWRNAKFGQFIHWGAYAQLGGTYNEKTVAYAEWIMDQLHISKEEYTEVAAKPFNPTNFNAETYVANAKAAGSKYVIFTSRHHDGFSMYDTKIREFKDYSLFSVANNGNYGGGDPVMELAKECEKQGLVFGVYYSIMDWHDKSQENWGADMDMSEKVEFKTRLKAQLRELVEDYGAKVLFFDGEWTDWWSKEDGQEFYRYLRTLNPELIINNRIGKRDIDDGDYGTPEQRVPATGLDYDWESCMTLNGSWGYSSSDLNWKNADTIITNLVSCASKGGNYLLNVGPDEDGVAPAVGTEVLLEVGEWLEEYGDSVYSTNHSCFAELPDGVFATTKDGKIYLFITKDMKSGILSMPSIKNEIVEIKVMGTDSRLEYEIYENCVDIDITDALRDLYCTVIEIDVVGVPEPLETFNINYSANTNAIIVTNEYSIFDGYSKEMIIDGDESTRWAAEDGTEKAELILEFKDPITVNFVRIVNYNEPECGNWINSFTIDYWDGEAWITVYNGGRIENEVNVNFADVSSKKFRLNMIDCNNPSIYEFQLFKLD